MPVARRHPERPRRRVLLALSVLGVCIWWVLAAPVPEGGVLFRLTPDHGLDVSDLATVPALALAAWLVWPRRVREIGGAGGVRPEPVDRR